MQFLLLILLFLLTFIHIACVLDSVMSACGESEVHCNEPELEDLCTFVDETNHWIDRTLATLGWTREHVVKVTLLLIFIAYFLLFCLSCFWKHEVYLKWFWWCWIFCCMRTFCLNIIFLYHYAVKTINIEQLKWQFQVGVYYWLHVPEQVQYIAATF